MDGWNISCNFGMTYFQGQPLSFRECISIPLFLFVEDVHVDIQVFKGLKPPRIYYRLSFIGLWEVLTT